MSTTTPSSPAPPSDSTQMPSASATTSLKLLKSSLRKRILNSLTALPASSIQSQSEQMTHTLLSLPEFKSAKIISVFLSKPDGEIRTRGVVDAALREGKKVVVPHITSTPEEWGDLKDDPFKKPKRVMRMLELSSLNELDSLSPDSWGIPTFPSDAHLEPNKEVEPKDVDLVIMPGACFDLLGGRLGYGGGFYDYFLWRAKEEGKVLGRVGVCLNEQLLREERIPMGERDWRVTKVVTGAGEIWEVE